MRPAAWTVLLPLTLVVTPAQAQYRTEAVRGTVRDDSARAVAGAVVHVTRGPDRLTQQDTTDRNGRFTVVFPAGTGDYLVSVRAVGYATARRRILRSAGASDTLVANFELAPDVTTLAAVRVQADRPERASNDIRQTNPEPGGLEHWEHGVEGRIAPTSIGDPLGALSTVPGVTIGPLGASASGSGGPASTLVTLNGAAAPSVRLPRAAPLETRVSASTYDATRGGFSDLQVDFRLGPGMRDYQRRRAIVTVTPQVAQLADAVARDAGARLGEQRISLGADGELIRRALTYNVAIDASRSVSDARSLLTVAPRTLRTLGISADSVRALRTSAVSAGVPLDAPDAFTAPERTSVTWLGRFDDTRDSLRRQTVTTLLGLSRDNLGALSPVAAPSQGSRRSDRTASIQYELARFLGPGRRTLNETRVSVSDTRTVDAPATRAAQALVFVGSPGVDTTVSVGGAWLRLGGSGERPRTIGRLLAEVGNETIWLARGRTHQFKVLAWGRSESVRLDPPGNQLGTWTFPSIAALEQDAPIGFTRTLAAPARSATAWNGALAVAHTWRASPRFQLLSGLRVEAGGFTQRPPRNADLESLLDVRTGASPRWLTVSPRVGFTWTYDRAANATFNSTADSPVGRFYQGASGTLRGGIGRFRDLATASLMADARAAAALAGGVLELSCVGAVAPTPVWTIGDDVEDRLPDRCLDGNLSLVDRAPSATLLSPDWRPAESWRASLDWNTTIGSWIVRVSGLASWNLHQPGFVDANFTGSRRFALGAAEGSRPVFVPATAIDAGSGALVAVGSRAAAGYGPVTVLASDLRGYGGQLTMHLAPALRTRSGDANMPRVYRSVSYTLQAARRQFRGFDGAAVGDPRTVEWAPAANDARHVFIGQLGTQLPRIGTVTLFARFQSGLPFTPLVGQDVNGDGRSGDRAILPRPGDPLDDALRTQLAAFRSTASGDALRCLDRTLGGVPGRNTCRGPWSQRVDLRWSVALPRRWRDRVTAAVFLENLPAAADRLAHGSARLRGWGTTRIVDPVLLVPRRFDAQAANGPRFRYDINSQFGTARPAVPGARAPFRVTLDVSMDLSVAYPMQQLRRAIEPVRGPSGAWQRRSEDAITAAYLASATSSLARAVLADADSLLLTPDQVRRLEAIDARYAPEVRAIFRPLGAYLANGSGRAGRAELDSAERTVRAYRMLSWSHVDEVASVLTPLQLELFPFMSDLLRLRREDRPESSWNFGYPVPMAP